MNTVETIKEKSRNFRRKLRWFTPVGRADHNLRKHLGKEPETKAYKDYRKAFKHYRYTKRFEITLKALFYAGVITSAAAALGLEQLRILQNIATYLGVTVIAGLYGIASYFNLHSREEFLLKREILLSEKEN